MIPTLFESTYVDTLQYEGNYPTFPLHGIVDLVDCLDCIAEETDDEDSTEWEMSFKYPINGEGFSYLQLDNIVVAKVNDYQDPQAFRIYSVEKSINKTVVVKCQHISYDMNNTPVKPFKTEGVGSAETAVNNLRTNTIYGDNWKQHHFYIATDIQGTADDKFEFDVPKSMRAALLNGDDSIKGTYGGDLKIDNYYIQLLQTAGEDRGVSIDYGVDLVDMTQERNNSDMITGILPYYKEKDDITYGDVTYGPGTYAIQKIQPVDMTQYFASKPTVSEINTKAQEWVEKEKIGEPKIELTVSYAKLGQDVRLHDAIRVRFPAMGIDVKSKVVKYKYNVLLEKCEEIDVGKAKDSSLFNLLDASMLKKGLIPADRIAPRSIGGGALAPESISGDYHIERESIDHNRLSTKVGGGGRGAAVTRDNIDDGAIGADELDEDAVTEEKIDDAAVSEPKIMNAAVAWAKLKAGSGQPVTKINALEVDMAYVNRLFASSAQIDDVWAKNIHASSYVYAAYLSTSYISGYNSHRVYSEKSIVDGNGNSIWVWGSNS